jgi:outer membrane protein assembly factor BamB
MFDAMARVRSLRIAMAAMCCMAAAALSACAGHTAGVTNVGATSAQLWAFGECDLSCTAYLRYRQVGASAWTDTPHITVGSVNPGVFWPQTVTGLAPDTRYEYQVCGQEAPWSGAACVGPSGIGGTQSFFTAPASSFGPLSEAWLKAPSAWPYAARPAVINQTVYIGSWDGYERAYDESGNLKWATNLGQTTSCFQQVGGPFTQGVTSAPAFDPVSGDLYLGDGTNNFDALDPKTGAILWSVTTDTTPGNYNWSSPLIYNGHAYIGTASFCDDPLTQGKLLSINLSTHQIDASFAVVPAGQLGGGIWSSPVVDPRTNTVFVTTGTRTSASQTLSESIVALDATTLAVKSHWQVADCNPTCGDRDWGTTPTLMTDSGHRQLIAAANKNGFLYAFDRNNLAGGPIWQDHIAIGGALPSSGQGSVSNGVFDGTNLYYAGGITAVGGQTYRGSVRAIDPATGRYVWERGLPAVPLAALTMANGELVSPTYDFAGRAGLWAINAATGNVDYANPGSFFAPPTIADGLLFEGDVNGNFTAYRFPSAPGGAVVRPSGSAAQATRIRPSIPRTTRVHPIHTP